MTGKKKIFIVGLSGQIGYAIAHHLSQKYLVVGCYFRNQVDIQGVQCYPASVQTLEILDTLIRLHHPDHIICASGINDKKEVEDQPKIANVVNVVLPGQLAITASRIGSRYIYISCADIFDGEKGNYSEGDNDFTMVDELGKQKIAAISYIHGTTLESISLRAGKLIGLGSPLRPSYFDKIRFAAAGKKQIEASKNKYYSYLSMESLALAIEALLTADLAVKHYTYHVGGANISEVELVRGWFALLGRDPKLVRMIDTDFKRDLSLDCSQMQSHFPSWKAETKEELYLKILKLLNPAVGIKKWQKTLQIP